MLLVHWVVKKHMNRGHPSICSVSLNHLTYRHLQFRYRNINLYLHWDRIHSNYMGNISQKKRNFLDVSLHIPEFMVGQAHWNYAHHTHKQQWTPNKGNRRQKRPCVQPSLQNGQRNLAHYIQHSQWYHSRQWHRCSIRLRRPQQRKNKHKKKFKL